ncbi:hypothetical protein NQ967_01095 [Acinetobacter baumannii]|nr:hypothetical protein [Acinetobacter baumannii]MDC4906682.1 hypothetical protein [Acinetobacter baumannii]MDC4914538.1 hypothetical protein [Acinetobacter baumannii]
MRFAKALAASSCSGGVFFIPVKSSIQINHNYVHLALRQSFSRFVLLRWRFLYLYKTKITYLPKALLRHYSRDLEITPYPAFICIDISTHQYLFTI